MNRRALLSVAASAVIVPFVTSKGAQAAMDETGREYDKLYGYGYPHAFLGVDVMGPAPTTADGFFQLFQDKNDMVWSGGDQMTSFKHNGYVYWLSGDTMLSNGEDADGSYPDGAVMVPNRILLQQGNLFINAMTDNGIAVPNPATHTTANNERYWIQATFAALDHIYVLCQRVQTDINSEGFQVTGVELAKFKQAADGKLTLLAMIATPSSGVNGAAGGPMTIQWSGDAIVAGGYVYFYGFALAKNNPYVAHYTYVARVGIADLENPSAWRFYKRTTDNWVSSLEQLNQDVSNQPDGIAFSQVSSVRYINSKYVMVHKPWNGMGNTVIANTSDTPYGPWSADITLFQSPEGVWEGQAYQSYGPQLHPEQTLDSGKTLLSINWNGKTLTNVMLNADLYKPRFYEVQF